MNAEDGGRFEEFAAFSVVRSRPHHGKPVKLRKADV